MAKVLRPGDVIVFVVQQPRDKGRFDGLLTLAMVAYKHLHVELPVYTLGPAALLLFGKRIIA